MLYAFRSFYLLNELRVLSVKIKNLLKLWETIKEMLINIREEIMSETKEKFHTDIDCLWTVEKRKMQVWKIKEMQQG